MKRALLYFLALIVLPGMGTAEVMPWPDDFSQAEPGEAFPGGKATARKRVSKRSFMHPSATMSFERQLDFRVGKGLFERVWVSAPASTQAADGLGPLFNARACSQCHVRNGRGHPPRANFPDDNAISMFLRLSIPPQTEAQRQALARGRKAVIPEPTYGTQLQDIAVQGHPAEGHMHITYEPVPVELADGTVVTLRKPTYAVRDLGYGPMDPDVMLSPRVAPPMIGMGLLEAIDEADIVAQADPEDVDGDGISGRANRVWDRQAGALAVGRFGWKAGNPTLAQQNGGAFSGDVGISSPLFPMGAGDCTTNQRASLEAPDGNSPQYENLEAHSTVMDLVLYYTRNIAVPIRRNVDDGTVLRGKELFFKSGCADCHTPAYRTAEIAELPEQSGRIIRPFTDLLLHDMGEELADGRPEGRASGREWRTPPLWGVGLTDTVNGHSYFLHDGRARNFLEAILWHGGEAKAAREQVGSLSAKDRDALISYLESL